MPLAKPAWPVLQRGHPLSYGLIRSFPFFENAGGFVADVAGQNAIGTIHGGAPWIGSPVGVALSFNGSSQYVTTTVLTGAPNPNYPISFAAWVCPTSSVVEGFIVTNADGGSSQELYLYWRSPNILFGVFDGASGLEVKSSSQSLNTWIHVVGTYDGNWGSGAASSKLYINGVLDTTTNSNGTPSGNFVVGATWSIAADNLGSTGFFPGSIAGVHIWNRKLSANEAKLVYYDHFAIYRKPSRWWEVVIAGGGTTVIRDSPLYLELLSTQTRDAAINLELLSTQQSNRPLNVELLGTQFIASGLPTELLSTQKSDAPIYAESLSGISTDRPAFAENLATQISAASLNLESLSTVISSSLAYLENLLIVRADYTVQVESLGLISISVDGTISIELLSSQQTNNPVNSELLTTQVSNTRINLEALSTARTDNPTATESLASVRADSPIQAENLGLVSVSVDGTIVLEGLTTVQRSDIVQLENISAVFALLTDGAIQLELLIGTAIPLDLTHSFTRLAPAEKFIRVLRKLLYTALVPYTEGRMPEVGALPNVQPNQKQTVGIDFGNFLPPGVALSGTPTVTLSTAFGTDPAAASRIVSGPFVGTANKNIGGTERAGTAIIFQVGGCLPGVTYVVDAYCTRTDGDIAEASTRFSCNAPN